MLVKPQTFSKTGRYPSAAARAEYLQHDGRAVEVATQNINDERHWYREMDKTTSQHNCRGNVVGREYILSPSPEDRATPLQMRDFSLEWAADNFPNSEVAILVHEDSKERIALGKEPIPHAHVYVNAIDLESGKKIQISNKRVRELHDSAQRMSRERGWSAQAEYWDEKEQIARMLESKRTDFERRPQWQRSARMGTARLDVQRAETIAAFEKSQAARKGLSLHEYESAQSGAKLEKTAVRQALNEAIRETRSNSKTNLATALAKRGVVMERTASNDDFKYRLQGGKLSFKGKTLGRRFAKASLSAGIAVARMVAREAERDLD